MTLRSASSSAATVGNRAAHVLGPLALLAIGALTGVVGRNFAARHGASPGRGAVVLGMGSLGARHLNAQSDLDLIVIYDVGGVEASDGARPLAARAYYARLTQALLTAVSAPTASGRLYEVDMRLRPSGRQGPVATALASFRDYQMTEAWTWEHLALTRARDLLTVLGLSARRTLPRWGRPWRSRRFRKRAARPRGRPNGRRLRSRCITSSKPMCS